MSDRLDSSSGSKQPCDSMKPPEPAACNPSHKHKSIQDQNQAPWPSLVPSSPKGQYDILIGRKGTEGPPKKREMKFKIFLKPNYKKSRFTKFSNTYFFNQILLKRQSQGRQFLTCRMYDMPSRRQRKSFYIDDSDSMFLDKSM